MSLTVATLDPADLVEQARRDTGTPPDEELSFVDNLEPLVAALDSQARLHDAGRARVAAALVAALATQVHVRRLTAAQPAIERVPVRPVFITGLLRTGTTLLQNLLAQHPDLRSPALWELMAPAGQEQPAALIEACEAYIEEYYRAAPQFRAIHSLDARLPEECHRLTANTFRHPIYALRYRVPGYTAWLREQSMVPAYQFHKRQLQCILWRDGERADRPVVLKCPSHLWHLDALGQVYPDAKVIRLHRSPAVAVPSVCSLTAAVRAARSDAVDRAEIGRYWLEQAGAALDGLRPGEGPLPTPPLDLRYADLVADPLGTVAQVCDYLGVPLTAPARDRMSAFLAAQPKGKHGNHHYTAEQFGLRRDQIAERFAGYLADFTL